MLKPENAVVACRKWHKTEAEIQLQKSLLTIIRIGIEYELFAFT